MTKAAYLAIDPGHMNGWATFNEQGDCTGYGQFHMNVLVPEVSKIIEENELLHIIVEDYVNYVHGKFKQTGGGRNETSKMIGKIETLAELHNIPVTKQRASVYPMGAMWGGITIPTDHSISHQFVAVAHGIYFLQETGVREPGRAMKGKS